MSQSGIRSSKRKRHEVKYFESDLEDDDHDGSNEIELTDDESLRLKKVCPHLAKKDHDN